MMGLLKYYQLEVLTIKQKVWDITSYIYYYWSHDEYLIEAQQGIVGNVVSYGVTTQVSYIMDLFKCYHVEFLTVEHMVWDTTYYITSTTSYLRMYITCKNTYI